MLGLEEFCGVDANSSSDGVELNSNRRNQPELVRKIKTAVRWVCLLDFKPLGTDGYLSGCIC